MCRCPFHNDRTPSMKVDERFHCFGCQADGDVISFTSRLFDLSPKDAALELASDFGIAYDEHLPLYIVRKHPEISKEERFQHQASYCFSELAAYRNQLVQWQEQYAPQSPDDDLHPRFLEALHHLDDVEYQLDVLQNGTDQERQEAVQEYMQNQTKPQEVTTMRKDFDPIPVYYETAAHARQHGELDLFRLSHPENIACKRDIEDAIARILTACIWTMKRSQKSSTNTERSASPLCLRRLFRSEAGMAAFLLPTRIGPVQSLCRKRKQRTALIAGMITPWLLIPPFWTVSSGLPAKRSRSEGDLLAKKRAVRRPCLKPKHPSTNPTTWRDR